MDVSRGKLNMAMAPYRYTSKKIAKRWRSKNVITSVGLGFTGVLFIFFSDNFFVVTFIFSVDYWFLLLTVDIFEKNKFIKGRWGGPTFKLWGRSWGPTFKILKGVLGSHFWILGGSRVPLSNFEGVPGSRSRGAGPTFTPCQIWYTSWSY